MKEETSHENPTNSHSEGERKGGREKQKIRIKYRQRVKIKKRPRGYKLSRVWKKSKRSLIAYIILFLLLGATFFMIAQVAKQQLEINQHKTRNRL